MSGKLYSSLSLDPKTCAAVRTSWPRRMLPSTGPMTVDEMMKEGFFIRDGLVTDTLGRRTIV